MLHRDDHRSRTIRERAYTLADTGLYDSWRTIEAALIGEGWPDSRNVLGSEFVRRSLDNRCAEARRIETSH